MLLAPWAKSAMQVQSLVSLGILGPGYRTGRERVHVTVSPICLRYDRARCVRARWRHGRKWSRHTTSRRLLTGRLGGGLPNPQDGEELHAEVRCWEKARIAAERQQTLTVAAIADRGSAAALEYAELVESSATCAALISIWFDPPTRAICAVGSATSALPDRSPGPIQPADGSGRRDEAHDPHSRARRRAQYLHGQTRIWICRSPHALRRS